MKFFGTIRNLFGSPAEALGNFLTLIARRGWRRRTRSRAVWRYEPSCRFRRRTPEFVDAASDSLTRRRIRRLLPADQRRAPGEAAAHRLDHDEIALLDPPVLDR